MKFFLKSKALVLALVLVLGLSVLAGCSNDSEEPASSNAPEQTEENGEETTIAIVGSTSVQPVAEKLGNKYMEMHENVKVEVQGVGSTAGVKACHEGTADIGTASRNLKSGEKEWNLTEHVIAYDGIAVVVHPSNPVADLKAEEITKIFKGEITNWSEVGGPDKDILIVSREDGSGTRGAFEEIMELIEKVDGKKLSAVREDALIAEGNGSVRANIAKKEYAIGYISFAYLDESVKGLKVDGVEAEVANILNGSYGVSRPFLMLTNGEMRSEVKDFLAFVMSAEGQNIVAEKQIPVITPEIEGTVAVIGSTSVQPVAEKLGNKFMEMHENVKVEVQGVGSTAGVKACHEGTADIGTASRNLKSGEKEWNLTEHVIAYDGIAVVVHPSNPVADLKAEEITKIFKGEITNWSEVGGPDKDILIVSREDGSGTRGAFEEIMELIEKVDGKKLSAVREDALIAEGNGAVRANIAKKEYAIGYISFAYLDESVKGLKVNGVEAKVANIQNGTYGVSRPFLMLTNGQLEPQVKAFLDFIMSEDGQKIVAEKQIPVK